jgi:hypothetical protein
VEQCREAKWRMDGELRDYAAQANRI